MEHSLRQPAASACASQGRHDIVKCSEKQFAVGQDAKISKLTDGGGVLGEETGIFLTKICPWTKHTG